MDIRPIKKFKNVDEYLAKQPQEIRALLDRLRTIIKQAAPEVEELISYNMPAYKQNGILVYFTADRNHIGFYPTSAGIIKFKEELKDYKTSKGAIQFPIEKGILERLG